MAAEPPKIGASIRAAAAARLGRVELCAREAELQVEVSSAVNITSEIRLST
eukprot:SAG11_NODE_142_length_14906_cov_8.352333_9_plen_51_part_00